MTTGTQGDTRSEKTVWSQKDRLIQVYTEVDGVDTLLLKGIIGREGISTPFNFHLQMLSTDHQITADQLVGTNVTITIATDMEKHEYRYLNGFISRFYSAGTLRDNEFRVYEAEVVPWLWFLQLTTDCRIFQNQTVVDIILQVLSDNQLTDIDRSNLDPTGFPVLEYCVQYRESAFDFVSRLMEEYGIFYFFQHHDGRHTMVLANRNVAFQDLSKDPVPFGAKSDKKHRPTVTKWQHSYEHRSGKWSHTDYNFTKPKADMFASRDTLLTVPRGNSWARFDYPGRYQELADGKKLIDFRREEEEVRHHVVEGEGTDTNFFAGGAFVLDKHDRVEDTGVHWVLTAVEFTAAEPFYTEDNFWDSLWHSLPDLLLAVGKGAGGAVASAFFDIFKAFGSGGGGAGLKGLANTLLAGVKDPVTKWAENRKSSLFDSLEPGYQNHFFAVPFKTPVRPPSVTKKPMIRGPQTAVVVGPKGREIWTDKYGRVRVLFHWDFYGEADQGNTSCWVRVSDGWAGREWGQQHLPRVGQEVIVEFLEGDPDRPIVTGRVYNGDNAVTFELPKYQTRSGLKTRSTPQPEGGGKSGYHMLRFEDAAGKEQILLRSQRRMDQRVYASLYETTHANRHNLIGYHDDETDEKGGSSFNTIGDEWNLHVHGAKYEGMEDAHHVRVTGDRLESFEAALSTMVGGKHQLNAQEVCIEGKTKITLKVGGSYVVIDPSGVAINGPLVRINSGGSPGSTSGISITDPVDASISDNGEPGYLEALMERAKHAGGGHRTRYVSAQHGPVVTNNGDGTLQFSPGIKVDATDPNYASQVIQDLTLMQGTTEGAALINQLDTNGQSTTIKPGNPPPNPPNAFAQPAPNTNAGYQNATPAGQPVFDGSGNPINDSSGNQLIGTGNGTDTTVTYNPDQWPDPTSQHNAPGDVILFHEMQHANNMENGTYDGSPTGDNFDTNEEKNAIGPENLYRDERGVPRRTNHHDL